MRSVIDRDALFPLYCSLFTLSPFVQKIPQGNQTQRFSLEAREVKVLAYADYVAIFCNDKIECSKRSMRVLGNKR